MQLDLKDYYDIKRPTVVLFSYIHKQLKVVRFDLLSEMQSQSSVKIINPLVNSMLNLRDCKALTHPSNNSIFIIDSSSIYLFDNQNELLLSKPFFPSMKHSSRHALAYNEGYIYLIGGFDTINKKTLKSCIRFNIVTEKWQQLQPMLFEIMDDAACAINEYQIVVTGGVDSNGRLTDIVQLYDIRENSWRLFEICLSTPRRLVTMVSSQKDRVIIIGGKEENESESAIVEEIDFLKRNMVSLAHMRNPRSNASAFMVNDSIYVFGGSDGDGVVGEKYTLNENKWREVKPKNQNDKQACYKIMGAASLLYE